MHETPPDFDTGSSEEWFKYFRWTSFIGAMPKKFEKTLNEAPDANCARRIMTSYAACALDISMMIRKDIEDNVLKEIDREFHFPPTSFLHLNLRDIATLAQLDTDMIVGGFRLLGFTVADDGRVTAYTRPAKPPSPPKPV